MIKEKTPVSVNSACQIIFLIVSNFFVKKCLFLPDSISTNAAIDQWRKFKRGLERIKNKILAKIEDELVKLKIKKQKINNKFE